MTTATAPQQPVTVSSVTATALADAKAVEQITRQERRSLADENLPQSESEAERYVSQFLDPVVRLWSYARVETQMVEQGDAALAKGRETHRAAHALLDALAAPSDTRPTSIHEIRAKETQAADVAALRTAAATLSDALERAADPHHLFVKHVATGVEVLLHLDRRLKVRRLRDALERARREIAAVRASADEHNALRLTWEARLGRTFDIAGLPSPVIREGAS